MVVINNVSDMYHLQICTILKYVYGCHILQRLDQSYINLTPINRPAIGKTARMFLQFHIMKKLQNGYHAHGPVYTKTHNLTKRAAKTDQPGNPPILVRAFSVHKKVS